MDEVVQLFDAAHRAAGTAPRSQVRRENLRHGATGVVVRDSLGQVYVHRRTDTKDVYAGLHDCTAGGVMLVGEDPEQSALRELEEELGVSGVDLRPIGVTDYADDQTTYVAFQYETEYDGPIRWQPEEVAWGAWMTLEELAAHLEDPSWPFVPDSRALIGPWIARLAKERIEIDTGWDSRVSIVEGRWVDRVPRRDEVHDWLLAEARIMPMLAPVLPLDVPVARVVAASPLRVRHHIVDGRPITDSLTRSNGLRLGEFLRTLHDVEAEIAADTGLRSAVGGDSETLARFVREVLPRVPSGQRATARALLERIGADRDSAIVHGDVGPEHVLAVDGAIAGVIDWTDAHLGDPAIDLAWALHGAGQAFADGVAHAYGAGAALWARALDWHRLGPWHEVTYGIDTGSDELIAAGIRGVLERLEL